MVKSNADKNIDVNAQKVQNRKALTQKKDIIAWLGEHHITNYEIGQDTKKKYWVNVDGDVDLRNRQIDSIAVDFKRVSGSFDVSYNMAIESLEGSPLEVGKNFLCSNAGLSSLKGSPLKVGGLFNCANNLLPNFIGGPKSVAAAYHAEDNRITSLKGLPLKEVWHLSVAHNLLTSLEHCPKVVHMLGIADNDVQHLAYFPQKVKSFACVGNLKLGPYHRMADVYMAHERDKILMEREKLAQNITIDLDDAAREDRHGRKIKI